MEERLLDSVGPLLKFTRCTLEADIRWIRAQLTACMTLDVRRWEQGSWVQVEAEEVAALLNPMAQERNGLARASVLRASKAEIAASKAELSEQRQADAMAARSAWSHRFPDFRESLACRLTVVEEESRDAIALVSEEATSGGGRAQGGPGTRQSCPDHACGERPRYNCRDFACDECVLGRTCSLASGKRGSGSSSTP